MPVETIGSPQGAISITSFITNFSDALQTVGSIGTTNPTSDWLFMSSAHATPIVDPVGTLTPKIAATTFDGANGLSWISLSSGAVATWAPAHMFPIKNGIYNSLYGKTQFVQLTYLKVTGNFTQNACIAVCMTPDNSAVVNARLYTLGITGTDVANWQIRRFLGGGTVLLTGTDTIAAGDVLRFSADQSVANQVTLTFKQNGTVRGTFVDNISPLTTGVPDIVCIVGDTGAGLFESRNFSCGTGL